MPTYFRVEIESQSPAETSLRIGFGELAENDRIVPAAVDAIRELKLTGGRLVKFNGPASLPVAMALAHEVGHLFAAVAVRDPKLGKYVIAITHDPAYPLGMLLD